jgi:hypothetical protein
MKVFFSWSGELSRLVAEILRKYVPCILQGVETFMSKHDLESGSRWSVELAKQLEESSFGVICLTPDNLDSPWLLFEAGALTKHVEGRACGILIGGLRPTDVRGPLSQFQHRSFARADVETLLRDVNARLEKPLESQQLHWVFEKWWPDIERDYESAINTSANETARTPRNQQDILEEILTRVRSLERSVDQPASERGSLLSSITRTYVGLTKSQRALLMDVAHATIGGEKTPMDGHSKEDIEALVRTGLLITSPTGATMVHSKIAEVLTKPLSELT